MVLRKVSKNLPLLSSSKPVFCPVLSLPASSSALASPQDCHWSRTGELRQQGWGQAKEGVTLGARGQAGCLGIYTMLVVLHHLINFLKNGKKWGEKKPFSQQHKVCRMAYFIFCKLAALVLLTPRFQHYGKCSLSY